uniref:hypothetical protein n=1 Tax=Deinococcus sp. TaxID=47478 RepID=UPI0025BC5BFA
MKRKKCLTSLVLIVSTALSWATAQTPFVAPSAYSATWPSACDKIDWSKNTGVSGTGSQSIVSDKGLNLSATLATTGTGLSIPGYSSSFANFGSWYEVRAVNSSIQPFDQAFVTRVNSTGTNTVTITFPQSVNNVLLAASDLDAVGSSTADYGDWAQFTGRYGGTTYNPDILVGGGTNGMVIKAYKSAPPTTAAFGATMSISQSGLGNSTMKAASAPNS